MKTEIYDKENLKYIVRYPYGFENTKTYPVIFFMHGAGGRGNDINVLLENPYFTLTEKHKNFPFITVAPLCSENTWFDLWNDIKKLVKTTYNMPYTDKKRLYAMGASMGGYATWQIAMSMPEYFAAIAPVCGGGMYWNAGRLINVPVWAFHGGKDGCVLPRESEIMVEKVNSNGGNAKLTVYPENDHNAWTDTYSNIEVFNWLLSNENKNVKINKDIYDNVENYG